MHAIIDTYPRPPVVAAVTEADTAHPFLILTYATLIHMMPASCNESPAAGARVADHDEDSGISPKLQIMGHCAH